MKKVSQDTNKTIVEFYQMGVKYKDIEAILNVNRWNIQDALSKFNVKTDRIKSHPRLPGSIGRPGKTIERYHDMDYLPPMKVNKNNPVLESDLDIMERIDNTNDANDFVAEGGSCEIVIDENDKFKYEGV